MTPPQRVLVTGGRGFLGSHVVRALLASGRDVALLTRSDEEAPVAGNGSGQVSVITGGLQERDTLRQRLSEWRPEACNFLLLTWIRSIFIQEVCCVCLTSQMMIRHDL